MSVVVVTPPGAEPIALAEAKLQIRVETSQTAEDGLIRSYIRAARNQVESLANRALVTQTLDLVLDDFPAGSIPIPLPRSPLQSITSITYVDTDGTSQTLSSSLYTVDTGSTPGRVFPIFNELWPGTRGDRNAVTVRYVAGWGTPFTSVNATDVITANGRTFADTTIVSLSNSGGALPPPLAVSTTYHVRDASGATFKLAASSGGAAIDLITDDGTGTHFVGVIPDSLRDAMLLLIGDLYERRESVGQGSFNALPGLSAAQALIDAERVAEFV